MYAIIVVLCAGDMCWESAPAVYETLADCVYVAIRQRRYRDRFWSIHFECQRED